MEQTAPDPPQEPDLEDIRGIVQEELAQTTWTPEKLKDAKKDLCILYPLPRVNEISVAIDDDPRACYFKQVLNGKYIRMALILKLLEVKI